MQEEVEAFLTPIFELVNKVSEEIIKSLADESDMNNEQDYYVSAQDDIENTEVAELTVLKLLAVNIAKRCS